MHILQIITKKNKIRITLNYLNKVMDYTPPKFHIREHKYDSQKEG